MSHSTNMQAFEKLTGLCTGYGGAYNPGQQNLQVEALITRLHNAQQLTTAVGLAQNAYNHETNIRELRCKDLQTLTSKMIAVLKSSNVDVLTLEDARALSRKIRRQSKFRIPEAAAEGEPPPKRIQGSGGDYTSIAINFERLIALVANTVAYQPNEPALQPAALEDVLTEFKNAGMRVLEADIQLTLARKKRNDAMYVEADNLYDTLKAVKAYVRGAFGFMSAEHEKISRLKFTASA